MWKLVSGLADHALPLLFCLLALLAGYAAGHGRGEEITRLAYEARLAAQERARAEAAAAAEKSARERLAAETARGDRLAGELARKTEELDAERASINRRLKDVSDAAGRDCPGLPAEWVRLYNEALGLAGGDSAGNEGPAPGGAADAAGTAGTARPGIREDALTSFSRPQAARELTTPEDVLTHIRDYGGYCRSVEAAFRTLVEYEKGTP